MQIKEIPSPNFSKGRQGYKPEAIVIHIMEGTLSGTDSWFSTPSSQVSAHYGVGKSGKVHQYVDENDTAWHAGRVSNPSWKLIKPKINPNKYTIGIEFEGKSTDTWTEEQKRTGAELIKSICFHWKIPIDRDHIIGHYEINSLKPNCPSENKNIINELINIAKGNDISKAISLLEEVVYILRGAINK